MSKLNLLQSLLRVKALVAAILPNRLSLDIHANHSARSASFS